MGKKGSWFSAIKRVFTQSSKEKLSNGSDKKSSKEKRTTGKGILRHGATKSFIPRFREPSSIEKILLEEDLLSRPPKYSDEPKTPPALLWRPASPVVASPEADSHRAASSPVPVSPNAILPAAFSTNTPSKVTQNRDEIGYVQRPEPTLRNQHLSATKIQAAYRGYLARLNYRALSGLVRLQGVVRGDNAKRQTINAMKQMQLLVRVQTQIQSRRIQMLENRAVLQHQAYMIDKEVESNLSKWTLNQLTEAGHNEHWDDSLLTKEEEEARLQKKVEAVIKRERAMAYAYSHQSWKASPTTTPQSPLDIRSNAFSWWWNWLERRLPPTTTPQNQAATKNIALTPPRPVSDYKQSPSKSVRAKQFQTPTRTPPPANGSSLIKRSKPRRGAADSAYDFPLKDDDSLTSCPPFSAPSYMTPTASAKAKVRANSNPKERLPATPSNESKRRFSFTLTPNIGSFKWNKRSNKDSATQKVFEKHSCSSHSIGDLSIDSAVSMPSMVGRKPFNRFV